MSVCRYNAVAGQAQYCTDCSRNRPAVHALPHVNGKAHADRHTAGCSQTTRHVFHFGPCRQQRH